MRFLFVRLENYIGLYNGSGLSEIEIDFSNARNKITTISGANGTGKSTIIKALNLLPDNNESFVPLKNASKYLRLTDGTNIYEILFSHPVDKHGNRAVTKVSLIKNGIELNPNGNVGSYKDIIFNELDIDANFLSLSKISSDNRGLADKKPAERKKIMASLISSLETYNDIYKNLNKKANIFKSYVNNLSTKIQSVGDEKVLRTTLSALIEKEQMLQTAIDDNKAKIIETKTILSMQDPDGTMKTKYDQLESDILELESIVKNSYQNIVRFQNSHTELEYDKDINEEKKKYQDSLSKQSSEYQKVVLENATLHSNLNSIKSDIDKLDVKITKLSGEVDTELIRNIESYNNDIAKIESELKVLGIANIDDITKDEIERVQDIYGKIISLVDSVYEHSTNVDLMEIYETYLLENESPNKTVVELKMELEACKDVVSQLKIDLGIMKNDIETTKSIKDRPSGCKIDSCVFVTGILEVLNKYGTYDDLCNKYEEANISLEGKISEINRIEKEEIPHAEHIESLTTIINKIFELVSDNIKLLSKFKASEFIMPDQLMKRICDMEYRFNELRDVNKLLNLSNSIQEYKSLNRVLNELKTKYEIQKNNEDLLKEYISENEEKNKEYSDLMEKLSKNQSNKQFLQNLCESLENKISYCDEYLNLKSIWKENESNLSSLKIESDKIKEGFKSSLELLNTIRDLELSINTNITTLNPISEQKKNIENQLAMLDSFKIDYDNFKEKYDFITKIRNYSSPTQGSIQSLFMSIYMDKTIDMVNQLLGMIFGGQYQILQYVINEDEFRIPFIGNGMAVDDISSGSTSQVCMMGMIINLVLADMSSSKYNIISLDEIDGGLDNINRYMFVDVLNKISDILNIDQIFIISHSIESALNNVDVVLLSDNQEYQDQFANANIIYQLGRD